MVVPDDGGSLLDLLREHLGKRSVKDGCSPQGQCGCCTVLVDGKPRAACVTAARRVAGRQVVTVEGLAAPVRDRWVDAMLAHGASQCGFCTPGILLRLVGMTDGRAADRAADRSLVERSLSAHLCRCTGWRTIVDAALAVGSSPDADGGPDAGGGSGADAPPAATCVRAARDLSAAARRATIEGGVAQVVGPAVVLGDGGFAADGAPEGSLVAVPDGAGGWALGETLAEARQRAGRTPGRNSTLPLRHPLAVAPGDWALTWQTTFVEPAYLELDASWCVPGGEPASPLGNGGAFGGKVASPAPAAARQLAARTGRPVRVVLSREDVVRTGPKRPPIAAGVSLDGTGVVRVARTPGSDLSGWAPALSVAAPGVQVEVVDVPGPPVSAALRGAGWAEGAVLAAATDRARAPGGVGVVPAPFVVRARGGGSATATVDADGAVAVGVDAGDPLDEVVLRSYAIGAAHQALGWVRSEGLAVDEHGQVHDLTIRSFGVLAARDMPDVTVTVVPGSGPPVPAGEAVFAAVATAAWAAAGFAPRWPVDRS